MKQLEAMFAEILLAVAKAERERIISIIDEEIVIARQCAAQATVLALIKLQREIEGAPL